MKLLTINICPSNFSCYYKGRMPDKSVRIKRIINLVEHEKPDIIFFVELWSPVFRGVESSLNSYELFYPKGFKRSGYAGVVAAVKLPLRCRDEDGSQWVARSAKWMSVDIENKKYLGVHYPQPGAERDVFHQSVIKYAEEEKPLVIIGDFNTPAGCTVEIDGYVDTLGPNDKTYAANTKLDYIFVANDEYNKAKAEIIKGAMQPDSDQFFSDHVATKVMI